MGHVVIMPRRRAHSAVSVSSHQLVLSYGARTRINRSIHDKSMHHVAGLSRDKLSIASRVRFVQVTRANLIPHGFRKTYSRYDSAHKNTLYIRRANRPVFSLSVVMIVALLCFLHTPKTNESFDHRPNRSNCFHGYL